MTTKEPAAIPSPYSSLTELVAAMRRYEVDVEGDKPVAHRHMMERADAVLVASPQPAPGPILTWDQRLEGEFPYGTVPHINAMQGEIADLRAALAALATVDRNAVIEKAASVVMGLMELRGFFTGVPHKQVRIFGMELRNDLDVCLKAFTQPVAAPDIKQMVNRFLGWPLPKTFGPDCGITFDGRKDDEWNKNKSWPTGTNLLTAVEAKAMFEYVLATPAEQSTDKPAEKSDTQQEKK
jgi:hypothetical protein